MNQLDRTVRTKLPATIVDARPIVTMTAPYHAKGELIAAVNRGSRRGDIQPQQARPSWNSARNLWEMPVVRLRPEPPAWQKPLMIGLAVLALLGSLAGLAVWMLSTLAQLPLAMFLAGALFALVVIMRMGRPAAVTVNATQNVMVRR